MSQLKNYTSRTEVEFKSFLMSQYDLSPQDYVLSRDKDSPITANIITEEDIDTVIEISTTDNEMKAYLTLYPPVNNGEKLSEDDLMEQIKEANITLNLKKEVIERTYNIYADGGISENILIAEGVEPISGKDAQVILNFDPVNNKPQVDDKGRVDYKNVDNIRLVRKGDLLLTLKPATKGVKGLNVHNQEVPAEPGHDAEIASEEGVKFDENTNQFFAESDGCVVFGKNKISVDPVYTVTGNVDYSVGNIDFNGVVHVKYDVLSGFTIKSEKDIFIEGLCQDAHIYAGGNVVVKLGIKGEGKNRIVAGGDVTVGYCENANISARGNIEILKYSYNSHIKSGGKLTATQGQGILAGGYYAAFGDMVINQSGTMGNSKHTLAVGTKYFFEDEIEKLETAKQKYQENVAKVEEFLSSVDLKNKEILAKPKVRQLLVLRKQLGQNIKKTDEKIQKLIRDAHHPRPKIKILKRMYDGLEVQFYREKVTVRQQMENMVFYYDDKFSRIAWLSLADVEDNKDLLNDE